MVRTACMKRELLRTYRIERRIELWYVCTALKLEPSRGLFGAIIAVSAIMMVRTALKRELLRTYRIERRIERKN